MPRPGTVSAPYSSTTVRQSRPDHPHTSFRNVGLSAQRRAKREAVGVQAAE
jgi:hypothetical protein